MWLRMSWRHAGARAIRGCAPWTRPSINDESTGFGLMRKQIKETARFWAEWRGSARETFRQTKASKQKQEPSQCNVSPPTVGADSAPSLSKAAAIQLKKTAAH